MRTAEPALAEHRKVADIGGDQATERAGILVGALQRGFLPAVALDEHVQHARVLLLAIGFVSIGIVGPADLQPLGIVPVLEAPGALRPRILAPAVLEVFGELVRPDDRVPDGQRPALRVLVPAA
ncbi:hypothetical protein H8B02_30685 [Bradyrhizobium sp. Pear77]|uniref:hypothetical protein n=1 Tax=Bradyrhizobium altum TaxID=1571202 RepID=UPI001E48C0DF|nr:hypothetical protein [Bradyrhizobium altum]MCC8957642.1 hypothetical protein [Bradyrhizobium altum]